MLPVRTKHPKLSCHRAPRRAFVRRMRIVTYTLASQTSNVDTIGCPPILREFFPYAQATPCPVITFTRYAHRTVRRCRIQRASQLPRMSVSAHPTTKPIFWQAQVVSRKRLFYLTLGGGKRLSVLKYLLLFKQMELQITAVKLSRG